MKTTITRLLSDQQKVYRLGLLGLSGAGKSCILAALGMRRTPHPGKYTATRLRDLPGIACPGGDWRTWTDRDSNPVAAFYAGAKWIEDVEKSLIDGRPVPPNPPGARLLAMYNFTVPGRGEVRVELIDYSGELLSQTNEALTINLRRHLERLDGLLILAEASAIGREVEELPDELHRLQGALKTLEGQLKKGSKWDVPVALLFNKWDRRSIPTTDEEARQGVERLLEASLAHRSLHNDLANTVAGGNLKSFAVSAFGESERHQPDEGPPYERPVCRSPLPSFGLEDPFVWLIHERDRIDWRRFGEAGVRVRRFAFWQVWSTSKTLGQGQDLVLRYSPEQQEHKDAADATAKVRVAFWRQAGLGGLLAVSLLVAVLLGIETSLDFIGYSRVQTDLAAEAPTTERLKESEAWLDAYANSGWYCHLASSILVLTADGARAKLAECQQREIDWSARVRANRNDVTGLESDADVLLRSVSLARLEESLARLKKMPRYPEADNADLQRRREDIGKKLIRRRKELELLRADGKVKQRLDEYDALMKGAQGRRCGQVGGGNRGRACCQAAC